MLGIDPGLTRCGYAAIEGSGAGGGRALSLGVIRTPPADALPARLADHLLALAPAGDQRFTSKRLADQAHAQKLLAEIRSKGRIG